jgi:hypothetical protein
MMKRKLIGIVILIVLGLNNVNVQGQSLVIKTKNGTVKEQNIHSLRNFTFAGENLLVTPLLGSALTYQIADISKIYFKQGSTSTEHLAVSGMNDRITVFPNPATDLISLKNLPKGITFITIYRVDGTKVFEGYITNDDPTISVFDFPCGMYLLKINLETLKFIKS